MMSLWHMYINKTFLGHFAFSEHPVQAVYIVHNQIDTGISKLPQLTVNVKKVFFIGYKEACNGWKYRENSKNSKTFQRIKKKKYRFLRI